MAPIPISLRAGLRQIGEPQPNKIIPSIPGEFHSALPSLQAVLQAMADPQPAKWTRSHTARFHNESWTEECQGITTDGRHWYISSNNKRNRAIHKFTLRFQHLGQATFPPDLGNHIGAIDFHDGHIFAPLEPTLQVLQFDTIPNLIRASPLRKGKLATLPQHAMSWCAINPWNGLLYSSNSDQVDCVHAYAPNDNFVYKKTLRLKGDRINGVAGGVFSQNGHLYLSSHETQEIRAYSVLNGAFLGACKVSFDKDTGKEMEGFTLFSTTVEEQPAQVHVIILDNDPISGDDVFIKHFAVPNPNIL